MRHGELTHLPEGLQVTPLMIAAANSAASEFFPPFFLFTARIALARRSLSSGSSGKAFLLLGLRGLDGLFLGFLEGGDGVSEVEEDVSSATAFLMTAFAFLAALRFDFSGWPGALA